jgi:hypothetical protein
MHLLNRGLYSCQCRRFNYKGGEFNEGIYGQMVANAYLDARLKLFD